MSKSKVVVSQPHKPKDWARGLDIVMLVLL